MTVPERFTFPVVSRFTSSCSLKIICSQEEKIIKRQITNVVDTFPHKYLSKHLVLQLSDIFNKQIVDSWSKRKSYISKKYIPEASVT